MPRKRHIGSGCMVLKIEIVEGKYIEEIEMIMHKTKSINELKEAIIRKVIYV